MRAFAILLLLAMVSTALADPEALHKACRSNLNNCAKALEAYAEDHDGALPTKMQELQPKYAPGLRVCPVTLLPYNYTKLDSGPRFQLVCVGDAHAEVSQPGRGDMAYVDGQGIVWPYTGPALNAHQKRMWTRRKRELQHKRWRKALPKISAGLASVALVLGLGFFFLRRGKN